MTGMVTVLNEWLSGFGVPVYLAQDVPDEAQLPYITIPLSEPEWDAEASFYIQIWDYTRKNVELIGLADAILTDIGNGKRLPYDKGLVIVWPQNPRAQVLVDGDVRSIYLNLSIRSIHDRRR